MTLLIARMVSTIGTAPTDLEENVVYHLTHNAYKS
jgi:hypothetical protein